MDTIQNFDQTVFFFINHLPHTWWSDMVGQIFSGFENAWILWFGIGLVLFIREERKDHWFVVSCAIASLCTAVSELAIKHMIGRMRPTVFVDAIIVGSVPQSFSFPSTHAVFAFACAYVFSEKEPRWSWWLYGLAILVCLSRIYLGHHYPIDVVGGGVMGLIIGLLSVTLRNQFRRMR